MMLRRNEWSFLRVNEKDRWRKLGIEILDKDLYSALGYLMRGAFQHLVVLWTETKACFALRYQGQHGGDGDGDGVFTLHFGALWTDGFPRSIISIHASIAIQIG